MSRCQLVRPTFRIFSKIPNTMVPARHSTKIVCAGLRYLQLETFWWDWRAIWNTRALREWLNAFKLFTDKKCQGRWRLYLRYARACCKLAVDVLIKSSVYIPVISAVPPACVLYLCFMFFVWEQGSRIWRWVLWRQNNWNVRLGRPNISILPD